MSLLEFEPVNLLSLHGTPIGGVEVFSRVKALPIPLPTTVAGTLGSYLGVRLTSRDPCENLVELYEALNSRLNCHGGVCVRGPLTYFEVGEVRLPHPYVCIEDYFVPLANAFRIRDDSSVCVDIDEEPVVWRYLLRVGIALERRDVLGEKRAMPGYFYRYVVSLYRYGDKVARPVFAYLVPPATRVDGVVRFGGKGSVVRVSSRDLTYPSDVALRVVSPLEGLNEGYYVALSPVPLIPKSPHPTKLKEHFETPLDLRNGEVLGVPRRCGEAGALPPKLRIVRLGLGFSEATRLRRPQILALPPGTVVRVRRKHEQSLTPLMRALLGLGFSVLYRLP